jgi:uncharacterized protein YgbK (DUF1537 family)
LLAVIGSVNEVARQQLWHLAEDPGVAAVILDTAALIAGSREEAVSKAAQTVRKWLSNNRGAVLYPAVGEEISVLHESSVSGDEISERVADALAEVVARLSGEDLFDALVLAGGDTAVRVARELGATGILLGGEIEAGVPFGTLIGPCPYRVVTKAGGFGVPDTLRDTFSALADIQKEEEA